MPIKKAGTATKTVLTPEQRLANRTARQAKLKTRTEALKKQQDALAQKRATAVKNPVKKLTSPEDRAKRLAQARALYDKYKNVYKGVLEKRAAKKAAAKTTPAATTTPTPAATSTPTPAATLTPTPTPAPTAAPRPAPNLNVSALKKGGKVKKYARGGGIEKRGKTKGKFI